METYTIHNDIHVYGIKATSFPKGVLEAHQKLHSLAKYDVKRNYFGISRPDQTGTISYLAAAEELHQGEFSNHQLETFTILKGEYVYIDIPDFMKNTSTLEPTFKKLIALPNIDPNGYCLEWYLDQDTCRCMVKMNHH